MHPHYLEDPYRANEAESIWQWRGKQDTRHVTRKSIERGKEKLSHPHRTTGSTVGSYRVNANDDSDDDDDDDNDNDGHGEFEPGHFRSQKSGGFPYGSRHVSRSHQNTIGLSKTRWEDITWEDRPVFRGCFKVRGQHFTPTYVAHQTSFGGARAGFMLVDVDLKVQASYRKEPTVPIVSLRSKVGGRAVIGHPIKVEPLEYGSTDALVASTSDHCSSETTVEHHDHRGAAVLKPSWRTARRTNSRVPRPRLAPGGANVITGDDLRFRKAVAFKKSGHGGAVSNHRRGGGVVVRNGIGQTPWTTTQRKVGKKSTSLLSNQKTRMLSSIGLQPRFSKVHNSSGSSSSSSQMEGVMKGETSGGLTTVSCIPVKLVFSRLLEKINRPPSKPAAVSSKSSAVVVVPVPESSSCGRMMDTEGQVQQHQQQEQ
ncbi:hypothetical protein LINPERHAP2_LOCUS29400 [Linum perenne]